MLRQRSRQRARQYCFPAARHAAHRRALRAAQQLEKHRLLLRRQAVAHVRAKHPLRRQAVARVVLAVGIGVGQFVERDVRGVDAGERGPVGGCDVVGFVGQGIERGEWNIGVEPAFAAGKVAHGHMAVAKFAPQIHQDFAKMVDGVLISFGQQQIGAVSWS